MSFGGILDSNITIDNNKRKKKMPSAAINYHQSFPSPSPSPSLSAKSNNMFSSPGLSLALQTGMEGSNGAQGEMMIPRFGENYESVITGGRRRRRSREEEEEEEDDDHHHHHQNDQSRSGSDNLDGDEHDDGRPTKKKRYHRHTPQQIQELESLFKECPHPDEKQRLELSRRLCLETRQVKFWFQNRRTQMKTQLERHENSLLRQENDKLRAENMGMREAIRNPICSNCGGPAMIAEVSLEEHHLRIENARLKDELDRVCSLAGKFLGRPVSPSPPILPNPATLELRRLGPDFGNIAGTGAGGGVERSVYLEVALGAMDELVKMAQSDEPLWVKGLEGINGKEVLNHEEYLRRFDHHHHRHYHHGCRRPNGFVSEASRESGMVIINSLALVQTLMDSNQWAEMFPTMIATASTTDVISSGMGGTRNGALQLMHAELQVLSPLVPIREVNFLRFCKQHAEGVWAVVDVSIDNLLIRPDSDSPSSSSSSAAMAFGNHHNNCRRLPSGCVVQDMPNGYSKVTWVEHAEYEESSVHQLYRPVIGAGMGFGAQRWVASLQRQCECLAILMSSTLIPSPDHTAITPSGRRSMLKLAQRMTNNFCAGVCASTVHKWNKLCAGNNVGEDVRVMTRQSVDDPGEPPGIVLSAATTVWLPVSPQRIFDFLRDERLRSEWDILSNGGPMQEMAHIAKGQDHANCVSLLRASAINETQSSMLILQETCTDAAGSLVVYAPVDIPAMHLVMNGGDSAYVALLPSGFSIVPDGPLASSSSPAGNEGGGPQRVGGGSLLTVAFQILVNSLPTAKLTVESVETVNNLISCTIHRIKAALHCES